MNGRLRVPQQTFSFQLYTPEQFRLIHLLCLLQAVGVKIVTQAS